MRRQPRICGASIKVTIAPVEAPSHEYEEAWVGALEILHRLSRRRADNKTVDAADAQ